jgi:hypothetical protein
MIEPSSSETSSFWNTDYRPTNNYNPSAGNFLPYITEEMQKMIKTLKINHVNNKISNDYQTLIAVIDCLIYHHYNSIDIELLHDFLFEFNQKMCENSLEKEELEDLWVQQTAFIEISSDEKNSSFIKPQNIKQEHIQQSKSDLLQSEFLKLFQGTGNKMTISRTFVPCSRSRLIDEIYNNLMENGRYGKEEIHNKYVDQFEDKFQCLRVGSKYIEISFKHLNEETALSPNSTNLARLPFLILYGGLAFL